MICTYVSHSILVLEVLFLHCGGVLVLRVQVILDPLEKLNEVRLLRQELYQLKAPGLVFTNFSPNSEVAS